eukprot:gene14314-16698_t
MLKSESRDKVSELPSDEFPLGSLSFSVDMEDIGDLTAYHRTGGDGSDEDDGDAEVIAQGRSMLKKPPAAKAKDSDDDEDDDSYVGPARSRPVRSVKKRRIVNDDSDEDDDEGTGPRYAQNGDGGSSDEEVFQPTTPLEKKMLKLWNFVDRSD